MMMMMVTLCAARHVASRATWTNVIGVLVVLGSVAYLAGSLYDGWVPHDTGQLGQTAERVLSGEMQHRDFDEPYTGGLGCLHAMAFQLFGIRAESIRWMLLIYFGFFVAAIYVMAVRVTSPGVAAAVTFLCAGLSVPIYAEGMPSWYNLFFATLGTLALLQHIDTGRRRWLFWAGCCAGCSLLMKITGLYFVAAGLFYIAYREQLLSGAGATKSRGYSVLIAAGCTIFGVLSFAFLRGSQPVIHGVHFTMPLLAIALYLAWREWTSGRGTWGERTRQLASQLWPYGLGVACVVGIFLVPYVATGSLEDLYRGLFVLPAARLEHAALAPPDLKWMCLSVPVAGLLLVGLFRSASALSRPAVITAFVAALVVVFLYSDTAGGYFLVFQTLRNLIPGVVLVGIGVLLAQPRLPDRLAVYLILAVTALGSLIQYPYAYGTYFFYAAPLMIVAALYIVTSEPCAPRALHGALLAFAICLAVVRIPQPDPRLLNGFYRPDFPTADMQVARCGLRVYQEDARVYRELVALVQSHTPSGSFIYATPDCPEVYFLSDRKNPTRTFYDLFERSTGSRCGRVLEVLDRHHVNVVVVNHMPGFSARLDGETLAALRELYPHHQVLCGSRRPGTPPTERFTVLWRESSSCQSRSSGLSQGARGRDEPDARAETPVTAQVLVRGEL